MDYKIKIGFSRPIKWKMFAWLIMKAYRINYDHVFISLNSAKYERELIYQASHTKVNFIGRILFLQDNLIIKEFEIDVTPENYKALMQFAIDNVGKPYGIKEAIGLGIVRLAEIFGKKIKNPFGDSGRTYICSELGGYVLKQFTNFKNLDIDCDNLNPQQLERYLSSLIK